LTPNEQTLFARLAVFVGGCRLEAAEAVCDHDSDLGIDILDGLGSLIEKSLLRRRDDSDGRPRYWMLETIREYAVEQLRQGGDLPAGARPHADYYLHLAEEHSRWQEAASMRVLEADHDNFRAANSLFHALGETNAELRLVVALADFWDVRGHYQEGWERVRAALEASQGETSTARAQVLACASDFARTVGRVDLAREYCTECLAISQELGDQQGIMRALHELGEAAAADEDYADAVAWFSEVLAVAASAGLPVPAGSTANLGWLALLDGDAQQSAALSEQALRLFRERGQFTGVLVALSNLAEAEIMLAEFEQSRDYLLEALELARQSDAAGDVASSVLETSVELLLAASAPEEAAWLSGASDALVEGSRFSLHPAERRRRQRLRTALQAQLGARVEELRAEGREGAGHAADHAVGALQALSWGGANRA